MPSPRRQVPIEVVERAEALTKRYTVAPAPKREPVAAAPKKKPAKEKLVAALKRLHPMD